MIRTQGFQNNTQAKVSDCQTKWAKKNHVPQTVLDEWVSAALSKVKNKATKIFQGFSFPETQSIFHDKGVEKCLQNLHERFVVTTADKAGNNIVFICKKVTMDEFFGS